MGKAPNNRDAKNDALATRTSVEPTHSAPRRWWGRVIAWAAPRAAWEVVKAILRANWVSIMTTVLPALFWVFYRTDWLLVASVAAFVAGTFVSIHAGIRDLRLRGEMSALHKKVDLLSSTVVPSQPSALVAGPPEHAEPPGAAFTGPIVDKTSGVKAAGHVASLRLEYKPRLEEIKVSCEVEFYAWWTDLHPSPDVLELRVDGTTGSEGIMAQLFRDRSKLKLDVHRWNSIFYEGRIPIADKRRMHPAIAAAFNHALSPPKDIKSQVFVAVAVSVPRNDQEYALSGMILPRLNQYTEGQRLIVSVFGWSTGIQEKWLPDGQ